MPEYTFYFFWDFNKANEHEDGNMFEGDREDKLHLVDETRSWFAPSRGDAMNEAYKYCNAHGFEAFTDA